MVGDATTPIVLRTVTVLAVVLGVDRESFLRASENH
jgi:hypothetical protein